MNTPVNSLSAAFLAFLLLALLTVGTNAAAGNVFDGFTKAPTFTPPVGCTPKEQTYGVLSRCEKTIEPGRTFVALIDTAVGFFKTDKAQNTQIFVDDHVAEIRAYWMEAFPGNKVDFFSRTSDVTPGNPPSHGTDCREYSIAVAIGKVTDQQPASRVERVEGLTCAWRVDGAAPGSANVELFWLEAYDDYAPALGQKPMGSFDQIVKDLFASARL
jgi:hypothetical protein